SESFTLSDSESHAKPMQETYQELRRIAARLFQEERGNHTLQPTALVHEAFIRLCKDGPEKYASRAHFFGVVTRTMRRILIEHARRHNALKNGGPGPKLSLDDAPAVALEPVDFVALDEALKRLKKLDPHLHRIAELRIFSGLSTVQTAEL